MKAPLRRIASLLAAAAIASPAWAQKTELLVYTALETDQLKAYTESFQKTNPNIDLKFVRDSTGVITAKLLAEKANPQADVVLGVSASSVEIFKGEGMLTPYTPAGFDQLNPTYSDPARPPSWIGMDVYSAVVCYNTVEGQKKNIPAPTSWADLTKPVYKGQITMPNPASSGTGFLDVSGWLQTMGEQGAWKFMDALHENVAQYTHSGSKPCRQAGAGEFVVGISFDFRGNDVKAKGAPVELIFPKEGLGWDIEASGILKTTKHMDAARKLIDWTATKEANEAFAKNFVIVSHKGVKASLPNLPADLETKLIKNNFAYSAKNRDAILAEWQKRYAAKSEPK
jgi:iron(III) transport system substrate-binding protein